MSETDPHIHVELKVLEAGPDVRNLISSMLGRVTDAPNVVTTGCGLRVPYAMTLTALSPAAVASPDAAPQRSQRPSLGGDSGQLSESSDDMRLEMIPDCGHFVPEEQPEWLIDRLTDFFG